MNFKKPYFYTVMLLLTIIFTTQSLKAGVFDFPIQIYYEDTNAKAAKDLAIKNGKTIALKNVLAKITQKSYNKQLDQLLNNVDVNVFDRSFSIKNESITTSHYSADAIFSFNNTAIFNFLTKNNIPFVKEPLTDTRNIIIPIYFDSATGSDTVTANIWNDYWIAQKEHNFLSTFIYYTPPNIGFLENNNYVANIRKNLSVTGVYLLHLTNNQDTTFNLKITNYVTKEVINYKNISFLAAISLAAQEIEDSAKNIAISEYTSDDLSYTFTVDVNNIENWMEIEKVLLDKSNPLSLNANILEISNTYIKINIKTKSTLTKLEENLSNNCIFMDKTNMSLKYLTKCTE